MSGDVRKKHREHRVTWYVCSSVLSARTSNRTS